ncbi:MAG TPA: hypothetical protein VK131_00565, partial [Candidatus Acidoferrales bacterium]|nr:hypothetical protein [Candidatus Acidoferrales bacterium]
CGGVEMAAPVVHFEINTKGDAKRLWRFYEAEQVPVTEVPGVVTFANFRDPDGHVIGLVKSEAR